jgi:hypothetical protein
MANWFRLDVHVASVWGRCQGGDYRLAIMSAWSIRVMIDRVLAYLQLASSPGLLLLLPVA